MLSLIMMYLTLFVVIRVVYGFVFSAERNPKKVRFLTWAAFCYTVVIDALKALTALWWESLPWYGTVMIYLWPVAAFAIYKPQIFVMLYLQLHLKLFDLTESEKLEAARGYKDGSIKGVIPTPPAPWRAALLYRAHYDAAQQCEFPVDPFEEESEVVIVSFG